MANSVSFQQDIGGIGVPNIVQQGVTDSSTASLISTIGEAAIEANRGYEEARLQKGIDQEIESLVNQETTQQPNPVDTNASFGPTRQASETEKGLEQNVGGLRRSMETGAITYTEFRARTEALTREAINRLPGRADSFRNILSNTLGDHAARLEPFRTAGANAARLADLQAREIEKGRAKAAAIGMRFEDYQEAERFAITRAMKQQQNVDNASKFTGAVLEDFRDESFATIRQFQKENGGIFIRPDQAAFVKESLNALADRKREAITQAANQGGWSSELSAQMKQLNDEVEREKRDLDNLMASKQLDAVMKFQDQQTRLGMMIRNGPAQYLVENMPAQAKIMGDASIAWNEQIATLDPNNPNEAKTRARLERKWRMQYDGALVATGLLPKDWQIGGMQNSINMNNALRNLQDTGVIPNMTKETAVPLLQSSPTTVEQIPSMKEAIAKLVDTTDGDGMSLTALTQPKVIATVNSSGDFQNQVRAAAENEIVSLVRNFELDARAVQQAGGSKRLPFGPAYDMKFADPLLARHRPNAGISNSFLGITNVTDITPGGVDENYKIGVSQLGKLIDSYPNLFNGMNGQQWMKERIGSLLSKFQPSEGSNPDVIKQDRDVFTMIKEAIFGTQKPQPTTSTKEVAEPAPVEQTLEGVPQAAIDLIHQREGFRDSVYKDKLGKKTVGYGHLVLPNQNYQLADGTTVKGKDLDVGDKLSDQFLNNLFQDNITTAHNAAINQAAEAGINDEAFISVLTSVNFQLGTNWTQKFYTTWPAIKKGDYDRAIANLRNSDWAKQTSVRVEDFIAALEGLKTNQAISTPAQKLEPGMYFFNGDLVEIS